MTVRGVVRDQLWDRVDRRIYGRLLDEWLYEKIEFDLADRIENRTGPIGQALLATLWEETEP